MLDLMSTSYFYLQIIIIIIVMYDLTASMNDNKVEQEKNDID